MTKLPSFREIARRRQFLHRQDIGPRMTALVDTSVLYGSYSIHVFNSSRVGWNPQPAEVGRKRLGKCDVPDRRVRRTGQNRKLTEPRECRHLQAGI